MHSRVAILALASTVCGYVNLPNGPVGSALPLPPGKPSPAPPYMVNNINNQYGTAPDKGVLNGPVLESLNSTLLQLIHGDHQSWSNEASSTDGFTALTVQPRQSTAYWLETVQHGQMPLAPSGYQFYRNVKSFGAKGDGVTDDTAAINRAISSGNRCGQNCGSTTTLGALVYFPAGTYLVSSPLVQYYFTQFVGNPNSKPVIKGASNFTGIALIDSDVYIPGGNGNEWYLNQNNFYRQIRNLVLDLTNMTRYNYQGSQQYVPTGIHWQVGQATSITNVDIKMAVSNSAGPATSVGIMMENGSGGFISDVTFTGGNYGFVAGSQQFTARNLQFTSCLTAINMGFDWGFTWQNIYVLSCYVALNCTTPPAGLSSGSVTGSISVVDSHFNGVPYAITIPNAGPLPNIVLDNLLVENTQSVVLVSGGPTILNGSSSPSTIKSWAMGQTYTNKDGSGSPATGNVTVTPSKPAALLDSSSGKYFTRAKPQYETVAASSIVVATNNGVSNAFKSDQTAAINALLAKYVGSVIFFPAGIYLVNGTINVPVGSKIVGEGWSQFMATGSYFQNASSPKVLFKVGNSGDKGVVEISDVLFTVQGPTAGCVLVEWNVHESTQGSAGMWDSHFRVGGAAGTNLQLANCPASATTVNPQCMAANLLFHSTNASSGYFENIWAWVADHDLDNSLNAQASESSSGSPQNTKTQLNIYAGRGMLIESQGPSWYWGTASEHAQMYQYQLYLASNIYMGHLQTETPYYQPTPNSLAPYANGQYPSDPGFGDCTTSSCREAWGLRITRSNSIYLYSAGLYSFFSNNSLGCSDANTCQQRIFDTNFAYNLWLYNLFTKGAVQIASPQGGLKAVYYNSSNQTTTTGEIAVWLPLAQQGQYIGSNY